MGNYAVLLGASSAEMGWFQSSANISNNLVQILWGRLSDRFQRRILFIFLGSLMVALLWIPMIFIANPTQLIILLSLQAVLGSMAIPAWTALIGDLVPGSRLGRANAAINRWASVGGLIATLTSGWLMTTFSGPLQGMFFIPLALASVFGIASSFVLLRVKEPKRPANNESDRRSTYGFLSIARLAARTSYFTKYCTIAAASDFSMSMSWPLFAITQVKIMNASMLQIAMLSVVQTVVMISFQNWAGKLVDTIGRKPLIVFFRATLITVPFAYALAGDINVLIAASTLWGLSFALGQPALAAYLLDISPEELRGSFVAIYNLVIGLATFAGSLIGGYLAGYAIGIYGIVLGLQVVYALSIVGRTLAAGLHLTLTETLRH